MQEKIFNQLLETNKKFLNTNKEFKRLRDSQNPDFVVIACSDSRITPTIILDRKLGDFFEIRVVGGVIDENALASIEYAVAHLNTQNIFLLAHTKCGAVTEAQKLFRMIKANKKPQINSALDKLAYDIYKNIVGNTENLVNLDNAIMDNVKAQKISILNSNIINEKFQSGKLKIGIGMYNLDTGELILQ